MSVNLESALPDAWTLYFHAPREKRWTLDTFQPIATFNTLNGALSVFQDLGDKIKRGMFFCMKSSIPPLWENHQNIRGGSYSIRGSAEHGPDYYKSYIIGAMTSVASRSDEDQITGVSISPKIMSGQNGTHRIGFYVIKVWNKDCAKFNKANGIHLLHESLVPSDILYTPHVDKKM